MRSLNLAIVIYCTVIGFAVLYETQPLLPMLAAHWQRTIDEAALLTTATLVPLAVAPLLYGYILEHVSSKHMLTGAFLILTLAQAGLALAPDYPVFLALRTLQGLMLPAIFTALMTYSSATGGHAQSRRNITVYIAATIIGGFSGRFFSGIFSDLFGWAHTFGFWTLAALVATWLTTRLESDPRLRLGKVRGKEIAALAARPVYAEGFLAAFLLFFVFAAMLNFLPFQMRVNDADITQSEIALVYAGYLIGVIVSLYSLRLIEWCRGERRTLVIGSLIYLLGTLLFALPGNTAYYAAMLVFAGGMFLLHSVLSAFLNHLESTRKGLVNGLYVSAYYAGGALGSYFPGFVYQWFGWPAFVSLLASLVVGLVGLSLALRQARAVPGS